MQKKLHDEPAHAVPDEDRRVQTRDQLPVLYGLAESFAVSDAWFSSVPTESNPNRAFGLCGSSQGAVDNSDTSYYELPTVLNLLGAAPAPKSWTVYWQYNGSLDMDPRKGDSTCFTVDVFPEIRQAIERGEGSAAHWHGFFAAARAGGS